MDSATYYMLARELHKQWKEAHKLGYQNYRGKMIEEAAKELEHVGLGGPGPSLPKLLALARTLLNDILADR